MCGPRLRAGLKGIVSIQKKNQTVIVTVTRLIQLKVDLLTGSVLRMAGDDWRTILFVKKYDPN